MTPFVRSLIGFAALLGALVAAPSPLAATFELLGGDIQLVGPGARRRIVLERRDGDRYVGQVEKATFTSSNPKVFTIEEAAAVAVGDGEAELVAQAEGQTVKVKVTVSEAGKPFAWSFRNHVQSVLAKGGCNSGACHGALAGKNGFRLSLRGYDAEGDYLVLTHQARGRRVNLADPGRSLLLTKPTTLIAHGGGRRIEPGSIEYRVISEWIAAGAPAPAPNDRRIERLVAHPPFSTQKPGGAQQLLINAVFSDGRVEDVTRWAKYTATQADVAQVDDNGLVKIVGHGEGAVTAWYLNKIVVATITSPYSHAVPAETFAKSPRKNFIDEHILAKLAELKLEPSPRGSDAEFLRRAWLDTVGALPSIEETKRFLADTSPDKRDRLIASLLERPEFVDYWTYKLSDLLLVNSERLAPAAMWAYSRWVRNAVASNLPWDELTRRLVTATGSTLENGAANFFVLHQDTRELVEAVSQTFLGMSINCARCHNHPLEKWTNDDYFAMASLVSRVRLKDQDGEGAFAIYAAPDGEINQPLRGRPQPPKPLDGQPVQAESSDRRAALAMWLTDSSNPYFARAISNRIWANFMGVGLVERVDDLRFTNPASNEPLLKALADHLVKNGYDLKALMRAILSSDAYQRSSKTLATNAADKRFYSRYYPRRLMAEVMLDAFTRVSEAPTEFPNYPVGWRALELPDSKVVSTFLDKFGRPERGIVCECERTNEPNMVQALHLSNGDTLNKRLSAERNRIARLLSEKKAPDAIVEELYLAALCRTPTESEKKTVAELMAEPGASPRAVLEDVAWGILSSKDFLFNH